MPYSIICTPRTFGPANNPRYLARDERGRGLIFDSRADAADYVDLCRSGPVVLSHNESGPPDLRIAPISSLPAYLRAQL